MRVIPANVPGASKYLSETECARAIKNGLIAELKHMGHIVTDSTSEASTAQAVLNEQVTKANASGAELVVSIHLNAGGGTGCEVYHYPNSNETIAANVSKAISECLGIKNRGAKSNATFYWLRKTRAPALLVEVCFVDSTVDTAAYRKIGAWKIAQAISKTIG